MPSVSDVSSAAVQQTLEVIQGQMLRHAQTVGESSKATVDYRVLQAAIQNGNVASAQAALDRLQQDTKPPVPSPASSADSPVMPPPVAGNAPGAAGSSHALDTTA